MLPTFALLLLAIIASSVQAYDDSSEPACYSGKRVHCMTHCIASCTNKNPRKKCVSNRCLKGGPGCLCPPGLFYSSKALTCVSEELCESFDKPTVYYIGDGNEGL